MRRTLLAVAVLVMAASVWASAFAEAAADKAEKPAATSTAAKPAATSTAPAATSTADAAAAAKTAKAVAVAKPKVEFQGATVRQVLDYLAEVGKINIVYDKALEDSGIDLAAVPVSVRISGLAYDDVLNLVLPAECGYKIENGYILVTTLQRSWLPLPVRTYDIRLAMAEIPDYGALAPKFNIASIGVGTGKVGGGGGFFTAPVAPAATPTAEKVTPDRIIGLIKTFVKSGGDRRIAPWSDEGGPATITYFNGHLIVSQTPAGHMAVMRIITMVE